jgi:4'-phosphopantetheinyl transferase
VPVDLWWGVDVPGVVLLRRAAEQVVGRPVDVARRCSRCGATDHGRPEAPEHPDVGLSLSRTGEHVVVAAVRGAAVGVDVERDDVDVQHLAAVALGPRDAAPTSDDDLRRTWVRKEAVLKAAGTGLVVDPADVVVTAPTAPAALVDWTSGIAPHPGPLAVLDLAAGHGLPDGLLGSLAVTGTSRGPDVVVRPRSAGR